MESTGRFTAALRQLKSQSYDRCRSCGSQILSGVAALAGYAVDGRPLYVGPCCEYLLHERASHIYWFWHSDRRCDEAETLWRFLDLAKFISMLESRELHFARLDQLEDPFEGALGIAETREAWEKHTLEYFREAVRTVPGRITMPDEAEVKSQAKHMLRDMGLIGQSDRKSYFVNCWHANNIESEALWRLYCPPTTTGVAICTTATRLIQAMESDERVEVGRVHYIDFRKAYSHVYERPFSKRISLAHEAEVRAVVHDSSASSVGLQIQIDLTALLSKVVPSPFAPPWFAALVESVMRRYGITAPVEKSELLSQPFY